MVNDPMDVGIVDSNCIMEVLLRIESKQAEMATKLGDMMFDARMPQLLRPSGNVDDILKNVDAFNRDDIRAAKTPLRATNEFTDAMLQNGAPKVAFPRDLQEILSNHGNDLHSISRTFEDEDDLCGGGSKRSRGTEDALCVMGSRNKMPKLFVEPEGANRLVRFASGPVWAFLSIFVICINTVIIGVEIQFSTSHHLEMALHREGNWPAYASHWDGQAFGILEKVFLAWMIFELLLNFYAQRKDFFFGPDWTWNAFDLLVVVIALVMQVFAFANVGFLRVVRLLRIGKMLRVFRVFKLLRGIRSMVISISGSMVPLFSAMFLMCIFMYTVALLMMQGIASETEPGGTLAGNMASTGVRSRDLAVFSPEEESDYTHLQQIYRRYGGIGRTMMTLFLTISGGLDWKSAAWPVARLGWGYAVLWTCYITFMVFGMLNVLTGIFVDAAIQAMMADREFMIQNQLEEKDSVINTIRQVFSRHDTNKDGEISYEEFQTLLRDRETGTYLEAMGLDRSEAEGLFRLLDDDDSGTVSIDEFISGFLRLKGSARCVDMVMLLYENRKLNKKLNRIFKEARCTNATIINIMARDLKNQPTIDEQLVNYRL